MTLSSLGQSERAKPSLTEAELIKRLRVRYTEKAGNGDAWAFIPKVRSAAAFDAKRTIDAYAMALWPSRGLSLHAFELKSSRSDWLRLTELPPLLPPLWPLRSSASQGH